MVTKLNDSDIIRGLSSNDQRAFDALFDLLYSPLRYFAQGITQDSAEAEDIVIRAFHVFWNMRERFDSIINIRAFFYVTVKNDSFDYLKSKGRREQHEAQFQQRVWETEADAGLKLSEAELLERIHQKIERLPRRCREIFILTYIEGMKAGEIAKFLNISTSTVTTQRALAIKSLKKILTNEELPILLLFSCSFIH